ncbi:hypothetical protein PIB30_007321 [Stylosanthes scabra]|uniref:Uncharacterized protein n=1 Tax=Stylosanthes scabra TaxID=79078 RepID=A0ABU6X443_9FABA|nr:hypothetical protein [Stylosanthes scabra]
MGSCGWGCVAGGEVGLVDSINKKVVGLTTTDIDPQAINPNHLECMHPPPSSFPTIPYSLCTAQCMRPVLVFGGFIQFQTMSIVDDVSLQQMISIYLENMALASVIELYVEFEQVPYVVGAVEEAQLDLAFDGYYSDSEEEFEGNYEMDGANEEDVLEHDMDSDVWGMLQMLLLMNYLFKKHPSCVFWTKRL